MRYASMCNCVYLCIHIILTLHGFSSVNVLMKLVFLIRLCVFFLYGYAMRNAQCNMPDVGNFY